MIQSMMVRYRRFVRQFFTTAFDVTSRYVARVIRPRIAPGTGYPVETWARPNYEYWRKLYYCRVPGMEISGVFVKPIVNKIASWVLGRTPVWKTSNAAATDALNTWMASAHASILRAYRSSLKQGDAFVVINADLTITIVRPDDVEPIVADDDFGRVIGWRIVQTKTHPTELSRRQTIIDEYYADRRVHIVMVDGIERSTRTYRNVIGVIPVVHIANRPDDGEQFGHPEAEGLVETFQRYNAVIESAVDGNLLQGRPTPVAAFDDAEDLDKFWADYGTTETQELPDGTTETVPHLDVDLSNLVTLSGGSFSYQAPGAFAGDVSIILGLLFYLILEHEEIPEFVMGNAIQSSNASADAQMPIWEVFIQERRADITGWLTQIAIIVLAYMRYLRPALGRVDVPMLQWWAISQDGRLTLDTITWAYERGIIDARTALTLAPVQFADIDELLDAARAEREAAQAAAPTAPTPTQTPTPTATDNGNGSAEYANGHGRPAGRYDPMDAAEIAAVIRAASGIVANGY